MFKLVVTARINLTIGLLTLLITPVLEARGGSASLAWDPSSSTNVLGYILYYGTLSGNYPNALDCGNSTEQTVAGLQEGVTYYFAATAYDDTGAESIPSTEVAYTVPGLPPQYPDIGDAPPIQTFLFQFDEQGSTVLTWASEPGQSYKVLYKESPTDTNWMVLSDTIRADGTNTTWTDSQYPPDSRVYCVVAYQPPEPQIISLTFDGQGDTVLTWTSEPGQDYQVLYKDSLADADWTVFPDRIWAWDTTTSWTDYQPATGPRFYQVRRYQPSEPQVISLTFDDQGETVLTWTSVPGQDYQVLYKDSLADTNWTVVPDQIWAWDTTTSWIDVQPPAGASRFYDVRLYQPPDPPTPSLQIDEQGRAVMTWDSEPGQEYQVLYKDSQTDTNWNVLSGTIEAVDTTTSWTDLQSIGSSRSYQIVVIQPEFRIISLQLDDQGLATLTWVSQPGQDYQVLYKDSLTGENWTVLPDRIWAWDTTTSWTDLQPAGNSRFYQVRFYQPPELRILSLQVDDQGLATLTWVSEPGQAYQVESRAALADGDWTPLSAWISAWDTTTSWTDPQPAGDSRFYRIVELQTGTAGK